MSQGSFPISVIGGGLIGHITALVSGEWARRHDEQIAFIAPESTGEDSRTTAILSPGIEFLDQLGIWPSCRSRAAPLETMRIVDATSRLFRSPQTDFQASELNLEAFGYNIRNSDILSHLSKMIISHPNVVSYPTSVKSLDIGPSNSQLHLATGVTIQTSLVAACDGKDSLVRDECGITSKIWDYSQTALVTNFTHTLPHRNVSLEAHTSTGPLTQVPLFSDDSTHHSSLVWVLTPSQAQEKLDTPKDQLEQEIESIFQSCLGTITLGDLHSFPLRGMKVSSASHNHCILLGESAHLFPPIGAQGFNLGLRDIRVFSDLLNDNNDDFPQLCESYARLRHRDISTTTHSIDLLNRSLLADFLPVHLAKSVSLSLLQRSRWLRVRLMRGILH